MFGIDPVLVLDADLETWQIRIAALRVIAEDREKEMEESRANR